MFINFDFTLHKTVTIDTTGWGTLGLSLNDIFFSDHLYNSDDKVEIIYSIKKKEYYTNEWGYESDRDIPFKTVVIDEDGVELEKIEASWSIKLEDYKKNIRSKYLLY